MKKQFPFFSFLITLLSIVSTTSKTLKFEFQKIVERINAIIKKNSTEKDLLNFTDRISKPEITTKKPRFISDYCPLKNSKPLDVFAVKKWKINLPFIKQKNKDNSFYPFSRDTEENLFGKF